MGIPKQNLNCCYLVFDVKIFFRPIGNEAQKKEPQVLVPGRNGGVKAGMHY